MGKLSRAKRLVLERLNDPNWNKRREQKWKNVRRVRAVPFASKYSERDVFEVYEAAVCYKPARGKKKASLS